MKRQICRTELKSSVQLGNKNSKKRHSFNVNWLASVPKRPSYYKNWKRHRVKWTEVSVVWKNRTAKPKLSTQSYKSWSQNKRKLLKNWNRMQGEKSLLVRHFEKNCKVRNSCFSSSWNIIANDLHNLSQLWLKNKKK